MSYLLQADPELLRASGKLYVVVAVIAVVFIGLAFYLFWLDRRLKRLETTLDEDERAYD